MYWSVVLDTPCIKRAGLDGQNGTAIVSSELMQPIAVCLDLKSRRLFWFDYGSSTISSCNFDGKMRHTVYTDVYFYPSTGLMTYHDDYLYIVSLSKIYKLNVNGTPNVGVVKEFEKQARTRRKPLDARVRPSRHKARTFVTEQFSVVNWRIRFLGATGRLEPVRRPPMFPFVFSGVSERQPAVGRNVRLPGRLCAFVKQIRVRSDNK